MKKQSRSVVFQFRMNPTEAEKLRQWAAESKMDMPDYLRVVVMQGVIVKWEISRREDADSYKSVEIEPVEETAAPVKQKRNAIG